jgi:putative restriction endonuclease
MASSEPAGLRESAVEWLQMRTDGGLEPLTRDDINDFMFDGQVFKLQSTQQGIRKPKGFSAALSFQTVFRRAGQERPYEDSTGDDGLFRYKWRGSDPSHPENVGLREAMKQQLPLIWFHGVAMKPARFQVITPVYIVAEEPRQQQFVFTAAEDAAAALSLHESAHEAVAKRYFERQAKVRVHQPVFRSMVLSAYDNHCAVCNLAHSGLLDAAHIIPDRDERGIAAVVNGLAMCKIHHAAFDGNLLGISPDCVVHIRHDLLIEADGPMLKHGLQELHGKRLMKVPRHRGDRPRRDLLEQKFEEFKGAGAKLDLRCSQVDEEKTQCV